MPPHKLASGSPWEISCSLGPETASGSFSFSVARPPAGPTRGSGDTGDLNIGARCIMWVVQVWARFVTQRPQPTALGAHNVTALCHLEGLVSARKSVIFTSQPLSPPTVTAVRRFPRGAGSLCVFEKGLRRTQVGTIVGICFEEDRLPDGRARPCHGRRPACLHGLPVFYTGGQTGFSQTDPFRFLTTGARKWSLLAASMEAAWALALLRAVASPPLPSHPRRRCPTVGTAHSLRMVTAGPEGLRAPWDCRPVPQASLWQAAHQCLQPGHGVSWPLGLFQTLTGQLPVPGVSAIPSETAFMAAAGALYTWFFKT